MEKALTYNYRGFKFYIETIQSRFGVLFRSSNNIGEPVIDCPAYKTLKAAKQNAKKIIDDYIKDTK